MTKRPGKLTEKKEGKLVVLDLHRDDLVGYLTRKTEEAREGTLRMVYMITVDEGKSRNSFGFMRMGDLHGSDERLALVGALEHHKQYVLSMVSDEDRG